MNKRLHSQKKADSSASFQVRSQFQSRPFIAQAKAKSDKLLTQTETENGEFQQQKFEATKLKLQAKNGTMTPEGQERLPVLQAKMSGLLQRRLEHAPSNGSNFANIPISRPEAPSQQAVQTKLTIGEPGDKFEIAADKAAEDFVNRYHDRVPVSQQAQKNPQPEDMSVEEKELQRKPMLQLRSAKVGMTAAPEVEAAIQQARGSGQTMPEKIRKPYEQHAGADYSRVKIHTDRRADQINRSIGAEACAIGTDVFMRQGNFRPGTKKGDELLRHELEHVRQQKGSDVQAKPDIVQRTPDVKKQIGNIQPPFLIQRYPGVIPDFLEQDRQIGTYDSNSGYKVNPNHINLNNITGSFNTGIYQYVVNEQDQVIIGTRGEGYSHPCLIGGLNPTVKAAGTIWIYQRVVMMADISSGHFQPPDSTDIAAESAIYKACQNGNIGINKDFKVLGVKALTGNYQGNYLSKIKQDPDFRVIYKGKGQIRPPWSENNT